MLTLTLVEKWTDKGQIKIATEKRTDKRGQLPPKSGQIRDLPLSFLNFNTNYIIQQTIKFAKDPIGMFFDKTFQKLDILKTAC